jgi:hypothetical protein
MGAIMLYHNKCDTEILLDLSSNIQILTKIYFSGNGINPGYGNIVKRDSEPLFYCPSCKTQIKTEETHGHCDQCGNKFELKNIFRAREIGGCYCASCGEKHSISLGRSLDYLSKHLRIED